MKIPKRLKQSTINKILKHAEEGYPNEICGLIVTNGSKEMYVRCENISTDPTEEFHMCPDSYISAEEQGDVVGIVHSHPDGTTIPSKFDLAVMSRNRELEIEIDPDRPATPWHIVSWPEGDYRQVEPEVFEGLLGRPFVHNVWDCWSTCEAYYKRYHNFTFPKFDREDRWWEDPNGPSHYEDLHKGWGFYKVEDPEPGDIIIMQIGRTYHPNHAAIYLGDKIAHFEGKLVHPSVPLMLHHLYGKKSEIAVYGGNWSHRTRMILRHKDM